MKKFLSLVLVAAMIASLFAFSSCDSKEGKGEEKLSDKTPLQAYQAVLEQVNQLTNFEAYITTNYVTKYLDEVDNTTGIDVYKTDGTTSYYNSKYEGDVSQERWYVDGILYLFYKGNKEKNEISAEVFKKNYAISGSSLIPTITESAFDGSKFVLEDGIYYVSVEITPEQYASYTGISTSENAKCKIGFDDKGGFVSFSINGVYVPQQGVTIDITRTVEIKNIGSVGATTAPADADSFRVAPGEDTLDKTAIESIDKVSVTDEKTDLVMIDVGEYGKIIVRLYPTVAPKTVENFKKLVSQGFYDGLIFHRVIKDFMIQGGDPKGDGTGGSSEKIKGEFSYNGFTNNLTHKRGVISMARSSDSMDSASSQFFIMHKDTSSLDGQYASFGYVVYGMETVDAIANVSTNSSDKPLDEVKISSIKFVKVN